MNSLNKVQLIGNVTRDPEVKTTPNGQKVATFAIATNRKWKDAAGVVQDEAEYHNIVLWRNIAELAEQYVTKGKKLYVSGYLKTRTWDNEAGVKMYRTEIVCDEMIFLNNSNSVAPEIKDTDAPQQRKAKKEGEEPISIEDIPS